MLAGRSSAFASDKSAQLLGQVDGLKMCVNSFLYTSRNLSCARPRRSTKGSNGPRGALSAYGSTTSKQFSLNLSSYVLGHDELGRMYNA